MAVVTDCEILKLLRAFHGTKHVLPLLHEPHAHQRLPALTAAEASFRGVVVVALVLDSLPVCSDRPSTGLADLSVELIVAVQTVGVVVVCHIHVTRQPLVALKTAEMFHVPVPVLRLCVLPAEDQLSEINKNRFSGTDPEEI